MSMTIGSRRHSSTAVPSVKSTTRSLRTAALMNTWNDIRTGDTMVIEAYPTNACIYCGRDKDETEIAHEGLCVDCAGELEEEYRSS